MYEDILGEKAADIDELIKREVKKNGDAVNDAQKDFGKFIFKVLDPNLPDEEYKRRAKLIVKQIDKYIDSFQAFPDLIGRVS